MVRNITEVVDITFKANEQASKPINRLQKLLNELRFQLAGVAQTMNLSNKAFRQVVPNINQVGSASGRATAKLRLVTQGLKGFRMEMLGVLFFGMSMTQMFKSMLNPVAELFGIFDLWGQTLTILFLPTMTELFPLFLSLSDTIMNLSPETKKFIGALTVLGIVLGTLLVIIGTVALGIGALMAAPVLAAISLGVLIGGAISAILLSIKLLYDKLGGFEGIIDKIKSAFISMKNLIVSVFDSIITGIQKAINKVIDILQPIIDKYNSLASSSFGKSLNLPTIQKFDTGKEERASNVVSSITRSGLPTSAPISISNTFNGVTNPNEIVNLINQQITKQSVNNTITKSRYT